MPDSPYISDPGWTCTITAGSPTVSVSGVVAHLVIQPGDHLIGAAGGGLAIGAVTASTITLLRNAPAAQAGSGIPLIVERGPWRAMPAAAAIVSREVYERMQLAANDGRSLPVIGILNTPPASPARGDRYLIGTSPTGAWAGRANSVAEWSDVVGGWVYAAPVAGWRVTINGSTSERLFSGSSWGLSGSADYVGKAGAQTMQGPLLISGAAGTDRYHAIQTAGTNRFALIANSNAETGANAGSNFAILRYADNGTYLGAPLAVVRASGRVTIEGTNDPALLVNKIGGGASAIHMQRDGVTKAYFFTDASDSIVIGNPTNSLAVEVTAAGYVKRQYDPMFRARGSGGDITVAAGAAVPFSVQVNAKGGAYNTSNYRFTAPVAGAYLFCATIFNNDTVDVERYNFYINGSIASDLVAMAVAPVSGVTHSSSRILLLAAGDYVDVRAQYGNGTIYLEHCSFSGAFLG